jgi:O-methyltransferase
MNQLSLLPFLRTAYNRFVSHARFAATYRSFRAFTMIPRRMFIDNLRVVSMASHVSGCVVECGVWRGGMSAGIACVLGPHRTYYLFDSFEGLPPAQPIDGASAIAWQHATDKPGYFDNCSAGEEHARRAMTAAQAQAVHIVKGWFSDTVPAFTSDEPIAILRLDGDWYESTMICLTNLFDKVALGGVIILDDYYSWDGCSKATHDFLSQRSAVERIRALGSVCYLIKSAESIDDQN